MKNLLSKLTITSALITTTSPLAFASQISESQLPSGAYYTLGTMFNNSWREILNRNGRICIKIVDGPPNNVKGREEITVSSVSVRGGKIYVDATNQQIKIMPVKELSEYEYFPDMIAAFEDNTGGAGAWLLFPKNKSDSRTTPEQNKRMQECINAKGKYVRKIKGKLIPGRF